MAALDVATLVQRACMLGLVTDLQVQECLEDGEHSGNLDSLLRILERKGYLTPWQSQKLLKGEKDGFFLGGYRLLYKISSGSFGRVFRADRLPSGEVYAIKVLRQRWNDNPHSVELFQREGKVGLTLRHPNIVKILAVDRDPASRQHYMVMEFVEGGNLRDFLAIRKQLLPGEALRLLEEAASGLAHAYSKGLTHRDIKPTNLLISSQGAIKVVDFGLAAMDGPGSRDDDAKVERTVDYAGLEKATGVKPGDTRSDIYFLGCVLYEMLSGRSPLGNTKDKNARMQKQRFDNVPPMKPAEVKAPLAVFRLVETMMALNPVERYQTPQHLLKAIKDVRRELEGKPPEQAPTSGSQAGNVAANGRSIFVVEQHEKLQDAIRDKFKEVGFRVLMSADPSRALLRFQQQPYDALLIDVGTVGEDGLVAFRQILEESDRRRYPCAAVLLLAENQASWAERILPRARQAVLIRPVTLRQLYTKICELITQE